MFVGDQCGRAGEAMDLYLAAFPGARVLEVERFELDDGRGAVRYARLEVAGRDVVMMDSPGPHPFAFNPAISLFVDCDEAAELDAAWAVLADGATVLMPLQAYDFSPRFGWLADRFGVTWQLRLVASLPS